MTRAEWLDLLYQQARVERVDYAATIEVEALCPEKLLGRLGPMWRGGCLPKRTGGTEPDCLTQAALPCILK